MHWRDDLKGRLSVPFQHVKDAKVGHCTTIAVHVKHARRLLAGAALRVPESSLNLTVPLEARQL